MANNDLQDEKMLTRSLKMDNLSKENDKGEVVEEAKSVNNTISATQSTLNIYGIRQEIITQNTHEDAVMTARRKLNDNCIPKEEIEVECLGDTMYRVGFGVHIILPFLPKYNDFLMYIKEVNNEWKDNGTFISTLTLTPSRVMDEMEWQDDPDKDEEAGGGGTVNGETASKIIALLKQQQGKKYVYGSNDAPNTFDCSSLVQYCYNQFQSELIGGKAMGRDTYSQCKQGTEVKKDDKNQWQAGDLLFWIGNGSHPAPSHVSVYLGNNQMIHAPYTGEVVKIVDITKTDIYAVRRVIPEPISSDSSGGDFNMVDVSTATKIAMELSFYTGAVDEGGSKSASGKSLSFGMCASNVYPLGTKFYIKGINGLTGGVFTVEDRGGNDFNSANRLDIYVGNDSNAKAKANKLGRQTCTAYKLK